jgi:DNA ligase-1
VKAFADLFADLDASTATLDKIAALKRYFAAAPTEDAAWAAYFLAGGKPRQVVRTAELRTAALQASGVEEWLFDECYQAVGDLAETIAHLTEGAMPKPPHLTEQRGEPASQVEAGSTGEGLAACVARLQALKALGEAERVAELLALWRQLDWAGRFLLTKLIGGGFRVGVSRLMVQRALAEQFGLDAKVVAQRMMGYTDAKVVPTAERFGQIVSARPNAALDAGQPYPFYLAHQLSTDPDSLGAASDWLAEWKFDGIRGQLVKRAGQVWLWSRGEELMTERFPDVVALADGLPDGTVLDGEVLAWLPGAQGPAPFALLQQRIGRKTLGKAILTKAPCTFVAYDLLEAGGQDIRPLPQAERRQRLEEIGALAPGLRLSPLLWASTWAELATLRTAARERGVEGLMLKHRAAAYGTGRRKEPAHTPLGAKAASTWWKWKLDPMRVDCVLIYAQAGHGRRSGVYTDYTFAVWNRPPQSAAEAQAVVEAIAARVPPPVPTPEAPEPLQLVAFAKAYSGLTDEEFKAVDAAIRKTTLEKFGPVRSVRPTLVFELGFEGINASARHKSGVAVRFPRMLRIRYDKPLHEADTLQSLKGLIAGNSATADAQA